LRDTLPPRSIIVESISYIPYTRVARIIVVYRNRIIIAVIIVIVIIIIAVTVVKDDARCIRHHNII
jgi:hypothetical protein